MYMYKILFLILTYFNEVYTSFKNNNIIVLCLYIYIICEYKN